MKPDTNKIDDAVLALLHLGLQVGVRAWKGFDWDALDRLHEIANPTIGTIRTYARALGRRLVWSIQEVGDR